MIRRRNRSHICLIFILCFSALEVPIASENEDQSLQNDIGNTIQENVNQDENISNSEQSKRGGLKNDKERAVQKVPRRQLSSNSSLKCRSLSGCKSIDFVSPNPIKKSASSKKVTSGHESSKFIIKAKPENSDNRRQDNGQASKNGKVSNWWSMMRKWKYATAKGLFKSQLEKSGVAFEAPEIEALSDTVAQSLVTEVENEEKNKESKDTQAMKLLASTKDLKETLLGMIKGGAEGVAEKIRKIRAKGRETLVQYCYCKGINLEKEEAKELGGYKKYVGVLKEFAKLLLQKQSADDYVKSLLPLLKAFFIDEEPKEKEQKEALAKSAPRVDNGAIVIRKKRGLELFLAFVVGPTLVAFGGALIYAVYKTIKEKKCKSKD